MLLCYAVLYVLYAVYVLCEVLCACTVLLASCVAGIHFSIRTIYCISNYKVQIPPYMKAKSYLILNAKAKVLRKNSIARGTQATKSFSAKNEKNMTNSVRLHTLI